MRQPWVVRVLSLMSSDALLRRSFDGPFYVRTATIPAHDGGRRLAYARLSATHATAGAANTGAETSAAPPRRRGCSGNATVTSDVLSAAGASARSASARRVVPSIRSQAPMISPDR